MAAMVESDTAADYLDPAYERLFRTYKVAVQRNVDLAAQVEQLRMLLEASTQRMEDLLNDRDRWLGRLARLQVINGGRVG